VGSRSATGPAIAIAFARRSIGGLVVWPERRRDAWKQRETHHVGSVVRTETVFPPKARRGVRLGSETAVARRFLRGTNQFFGATNAGPAPEI